MQSHISDTAMVQIMSDPQYKGRHLVIIKDQVFSAKSARQAKKMLQKLEQEYPHERPTLTYIPKGDTLILWL